MANSDVRSLILAKNIKEKITIFFDKCISKENIYKTNKLVN